MAVEPAFQDQEDQRDRRDRISPLFVWLAAQGGEDLRRGSSEGGRHLLFTKLYRVEMLLTGFRWPSGARDHDPRPVPLLSVRFGWTLGDMKLGPVTMVTRRQILLGWCWAGAAALMLWWLFLISLPLPGGQARFFLDLLGWA